MNCTDNENLIITDKSSPVKESEETGASLPVKDLFVGIQKQTYVELSCLITSQVVGHVKYTLDFCGLNATQVGNRRKPRPSERPFKI